MASISTGARGSAPTSAASRATATLANSQAQYRQRLVNCSNSLLENFTQIVQCSHVASKEDDEIDDTTLITREGFEIEVRSNNIVRAAESLLTLIAELKEKILFTDFEALSLDVTTRSDMLNNCRKESEEKLRSLQADVDAHLHDLETEYYAMNHNTIHSLQ